VAVVPVVLAALLIGLDNRGRFELLGWFVTGAISGVVCTFMFDGFLVPVGWPGWLFGTGVGLIAVGRCWDNGDKTGRALALIGCTPPVTYLLYLYLVRFGP
jgi:hypothetical protein